MSDGIGKSGFLFAPRTRGQQQAFDLCRQSTVAFLTGMAGTGKTHAALAAAFYDLRDKKVNRIVLTRPLVTVGEDLGFLKGKLDEKLEPWVQCFMDCMPGLTFANVELLFKEYVEVVPIAYIRGRTFARAAVVLDEAQNCTYKQLKAVLYRLGRGGKIFVCGDEEQQDRPGAQYLRDVATTLNGIVHEQGEEQYTAGHVHLTEQCRHPFIAVMDSCLRDMEKKAIASVN